MRADEAGVVGGEEHLRDHPLSAYTRVDDIDFMGVLYKRNRNGLQVPHAASPLQAEDVDAVLEGIDLLLLRLLPPIEDAVGKEEGTHGREYVIPGKRQGHAD